MRMNAETARRFTEDGHVGRVAAECVDVAAHPAECRLLIQEAVVSGRPVWRLRRQRRVGHPTESSQSVVEGHEHDVATQTDAGRNRRSHPLRKPRHGCRPSRVSGAARPLGRPSVCRRSSRGSLPWCSRFRTESRAAGNGWQICSRHADSSTTRQVVAPSSAMLRRGEQRTEFRGTGIRSSCRLLERARDPS
jgi:hypothetical protein